MLEENLDRNFGFLTNDVARLLQNDFDRRVRSLGITRAQWRVLMWVYRTPGVTQSELADTLDVQKAALGRMLDRLNDKGWIKREADSGDRRIRRVHLSKEVKPLITTMRKIAAELRAAAMQGIPEADRERFVDTLLLVKNNLIAFQGNHSNGAGVSLNE
ncbi:MAG: MarR family transcriptional regulator [Rhodospirillales bacterium]|nr:MarR family transcriptional regulator [Rhodospirillales bacterium]